MDNGLLRHCSGCDNDFPETSEFFHRKMGGFCSQCKICRNRYVREHTKQKPEQQDDFVLNAWLTLQEVVDIISTNSGHQICVAYVYTLVQRKKIFVWKVQPGVTLFRRTDVELIRVGTNEGKRKQLVNYKRVRIDAFLACLSEDRWIDCEEWIQMVSEKYPNLRFAKFTFTAVCAYLVTNGFVEDDGGKGQKRLYRRMSCNNMGDSAILMPEKENEALMEMEVPSERDVIGS